MATSDRIPALPTPAQLTTSGPSGLAVWLLIVFLVLEYVRPWLLAVLRLQMAIIVIMAVLWFMSRNRPWSGILAAQVLFFVLCLQAIPFASNNYAAFETTRIMFGHLTIALGLSWLLSTLSTFRRVAFAWLLIMAYLGAYGLTHGGQGPGSMVGDENDLALGCATAFPFAFYGFERLSGWRRWLSAAIGGVLVSAIVVSFSRGGFVALAAVALYCWGASRHKLRGLAVLALALMLVAATAADKGRTGESYMDRLRSMFETDEGSAEARQFLWSAARNMWKANPILGVGAGNFTFLVGRYQPLDYEKPDFLERDWSGTVTHSTYFQIAAEQGSAGLLLFAYVLWAHLRTIRRLRRQVASVSGIPPEVGRDADLYGGALGGAMVGYCVAGAFLSVAYYPYFWYFSAMAVALEAAVRREVSQAVASSAAAETQPATAGASNPRITGRSIDIFRSRRWSPRPDR
jgi:O-antigen ligase